MKYAIVESGGKQYRAVEDGTLEVDRLPVEPGASVKLEQVLLLADGETFTVGTPVIKDMTVWTKVLEHFKGEKVTIFNYSPKKRIRVKTGHRQNYTRLLVQQIGGAQLIIKEAAPKAEKKKIEEPKAEKTAASKTGSKAPAKTSTPKAKAEGKKPESKAAAKTASSKGKAEPKQAGKTTTPKTKAEPKVAAKTASPKGKAEPKAKTPAKPAAKKSETK